MITIREAKKEDIPAILSLYSEKEIDDGKVLDIDTANILFTEIMSYPDYKIYLCMHDNNIVGTFSLVILTNLAHMGAKSGLIEDVVVLEKYRSKGIGKGMMRFVIEKCREKCCYKIALSSNMKRVRAHQFYEDIGFKKHGFSFTMELE